MDAQLVLNAAHVDSSVALVVDEHGEAAAVACALFTACQDEVQVGVAVGDEALHAVQAPAVVGLIVGGFQHDALQVGSGIGFGQVHGHGLSGADAGDEAAVLVFVAELIERLDAVLQRPDVAESGISHGHNLGTYGVGRDGKVQSAEATGHGHTVQSGLHHGVQVLLRAAGVFHAAVGAVGAFGVHSFGIGSDDLARDFAGDFQYLVVRVKGIGIILRGVVIFIFVFVSAFLQFADAFHHRIVEMVFQFGMFCIEISHGLLAM